MSRYDNSPLFSKFEFGAVKLLLDFPPHSRMTKTQISSRATFSGKSNTFSVSNLNQKKHIPKTCVLFLL